jgi:serine phosphatase RsbU (regulator of sigma subunit)/ligand-binding sensor domain-containing protein
MLRLYFSSLWLLLLCLHSAILFAQELGQPFVKNYFPKNYNAHVQNWDLIQDSRGIMYFGNGDGVLEYDGVNFSLLVLPNKTTVRSFAQDKNGIIYVGSTGHFGYLKVDSLGKMQYVNLAEKLDKKDLDFKDVWGVSVAKDGIYFRTYKKLFRADKSGKIKVWNTKSNFRNDFILQNQFFIKVDDRGLLTPNGDSLVLANGGAEFRGFGFTDGYPLNDNEIYLPSRRTRLATKDYAGLLVYSPFKPYSDTTYLKKLITEVDSFIINKGIYTIDVLPNKNIVLASNNSGAVVISPNGKLLQEVTQNKTKLQSDGATEILTDKQGATWFSMSKGIVKLDLQSPITFWNEQNSTLKGVPEAIIRHKGVMYVATHAGMFYIDKKNELQRIPPFDSQCWSLLNFISPEKDTILLAAAREVYVIKDFKGTRIKLDIGNEAAFEMYQSKKTPNRVFVALGAGFSAMRYEKGVWIDEGRMENFSDNIRGIAEDEEGNIWLGSFREGIYKVVPSDNFTKPKSITHYTEKDGIPSQKNILVYHFNDKIIFGTEKGLITFDKASNKFVPFKGLPTNLQDGSRDVFSFIQDDKGNVWLSGLFNKTGEIALLEPNTTSKGTYNYLSAPFKPIPEMMVLAFYVEGDSICWVGGSEGLYRFDRKLINPKQEKFVTLIRKVRINQDSVVFNGHYPQEKESDLGKVLWYGEQQPAFTKLKFPYKFNSVTIEYAAPNYLDESNTLYSHQLEGYDKEWSSWTKQTQKEYTNLREGKYLFKVKARDITGNETEVATYEFTILSPWYRTWWAYILYAVMGAVFMYFVVKYYTRKLELDKARLETLVQNRTQEVMLKNAELEQQKEEIEAQRDNLRNANEEILLANTELEQQKEEIEAQAENLREANNEISTKNHQIEKAFQNIQVISEIGQKITASLDLEKVIQMVYESVNSLMDATCFGIGVYMPDAKSLIFQGFIEKGETLPTHLEQINKHKPTLAAICLTEQKEIVINNIYADASEFGVEIVAQSGDLPMSLIYLPLTIEDRTVGVITVQSFEANKYEDNEVNLLKTLAAYISIAIENSHSYEVIHQKNRSITDSIRYAKTIQQAMLPTDNALKSVLNQYFVLYKPKDVVSGDFYWLAEHEPTTFFVAVVDCTGHGVPGAFMSMISMSLLHEAVGQQNILEPSEILSYINVEIRNSLKQTETNNRDGMDLALCRVERTTIGAKVVFGGAKRPLYYTQNGELLEMKGTRKNIGGSQKQVHSFEQHTIELATGEMVYLVSDGYADQSNEDREKFGINEFKDLLAKIAPLNTEEQAHTLQESLEKHQGYTHQRDDITVLGFRI